MKKLVDKINEMKEKIKLIKLDKTFKTKLKVIKTLYREIKVKRVLN